MPTTTTETPKKRVSAAEKKRRAVREIVWPDLDERLVWKRADRKGFITIPRTLPLVCEIINCLTKGSPAGSAYMELWCRSFDECYVDLDDEDGMAFSSGFGGQRATSTWRGRIQSLEKLGFIELRNTGGKRYALLYNPYQVIYRLHRDKTPGLTSDHVTALAVRAAEIGASDMDEAARIVGKKPKK